MSFHSLRSALVLSAALAVTAFVPVVHAATPSRGGVYLSQISGPLYFATYTFNGTTMTLSTPHLVALLSRGGGVQVLPDRRVAVVGAGNVSLFDPRTHTVVTASSQNNANTVTFDPDVARLWVGWKDTVLSEVPLAPFGNGTAHQLTGDDGAATMIAFTPLDGVFYTTGGESENGSFGQIDLGTFTTTRLTASVFATGVMYDAATDSVVTAGLGHARQVQPSTPAVELSSRDDTAAGENYLVLTPTGDKHFLGPRLGGNGGVTLIDASATGLIGDPTSVLAFASTGTLGGFSGGLGVDMDSLFYDGFEGPAQVGP
jgi:hypothetical protein